MGGRRPEQAVGRCLADCQEGLLERSQPVAPDLAGLWFHEGQERQDVAAAGLQRLLELVTTIITLRVGHGVSGGDIRVTLR